ncbi:hypothetical protein HOY80DRAFT_971565 [Tuber brumale]|nr:hypothetical protein HOY80DRAFT_971565 [Tuber brumale]
MFTSSFPIPLILIRSNWVLGEKQQCIYITCVGAFYYHYHFSFFLSSLVLSSTKKWRFEREAVRQVLACFFCFLFSFSPSLSSFSFNLWPFFVSFLLFVPRSPVLHLTRDLCVCVLIDCSWTRFSAQQIQNYEFSWLFWGCRTCSS